MSDLSTIDGWRIRRRDVTHGTVVSMVTDHLRTLRYFLDRGDMSGTASLALRDAADTLELLREWAREHQPEEAPPKPLPNLWPRSPAESDG